MNFTSLRSEVADGVATITLDRPDTLNAFTSRMRAELAAALDAAAEDEAVRAVVLTGAGRAFCSGQDLTDVNVGDGRNRAEVVYEVLEQEYNPLVKALRELEKPAIAAVNGVCAGGGVGIALACDIVLAARSAEFIESFCQLGIVPDVGSTYFLPRLIGTARASAMMLLGEPVPAEKAEQWGLVWKCVDDADLMDEAQKLARHLASQATKGLALTKTALDRSLDSSLDAQLKTEAELQGRALRTEDFIEGLAAFLGKRAPAFKGR
jgi:2-(1,2-epoxy-1,2-dihydrophenyl)acetyl-CoA isomerase